MRELKRAGDFQRSQPQALHIPFGIPSTRVPESFLKKTVRRAGIGGGMEEQDTAKDTGRRAAHS